MPYLDISPDKKTKRNNALTLLAAMVFPNDELKRKANEECILALDYLNECNSIVTDSRPSDSEYILPVMHYSFPERLLWLVKHAPPFDVLNKEADAIGNKAISSGRILYMLFLHDLFNLNERGIKDFGCERAAFVLNKICTNFVVFESLEIWKTHRTVSHFWAALLACWNNANIDNIQKVTYLEFVESQLEHILSLSELFRDFGQTFISPRSKRPIFSDDELIIEEGNSFDIKTKFTFTKIWKVPKDIKLPPDKFITPSEEEILHEAEKLNSLVKDYSDAEAEKLKKAERRMKKEAKVKK